MRFREQEGAMIRRRLGPWVLCLASACVPGILTAQPEPPLDNAQIIKLTRLDMGDAVIIAKIKFAKEVNFDTSTDTLARLKEAGVSRAVITAMIERPSTTPGALPQTAGSDFEPTVTLRSREGSIGLKAVYGTAKTKASPFSIVTWVQFDDLSARTRIRDRRPTLLIATDRDPRGRWWFVRTSQQEDEDYRYFDLEGNGVFSVVWSGAPEEGSIVKCDAIEEQPGLWGLTPLRELKAGEYGLFTGQAQGALLFDFGIDR
jgi:hypothetical protein